MAPVGRSTPNRPRSQPPRAGGFGSCSSSAVCSSSWSALGCSSPRPVRIDDHRVGRWIGRTRCATSASGASSCASVDWPLPRRSRAAVGTGVKKSGPTKERTRSGLRAGAQGAKEEPRSSSVPEPHSGPAKRHGSRRAPAIPNRRQRRPCRTFGISCIRTSSLRQSSKRLRTGCSALGRGDDDREHRSCRNCWGPVRIHGRPSRIHRSRASGLTTRDQAEESRVLGKREQESTCVGAPHSNVAEARGEPRWGEERHTALSKGSSAFTPV